LDGTVYRGSEAVTGAVEALMRLVQAGWAFRFMTNNSAAQPEAVAGKLKGLGIPCEPGWVYGTGPLAARYCGSRGHVRVGCLGEPGLKETLSKAGIELTDVGASAVVVGIARQATYADIATAARLVRAGAEFIATNRDATYPLEGGRLEPGAGALVAAVEVASERAPLTLGKPETGLVDWILRDLRLKPEELLVVGDRVDTDIECGRRAGCPTWLTLTGVESELPAGQPGGATLLELADTLLGR
jgi:4-nitrophenyl phosphatase